MWYRKQRKICCLHKSFKTSIKSWINTKKGTQSNSIQSKSMVKTYIDMNTRLKKEVKNKFGKDFFKLMNNAVIGKTVKNVRNHRDIKLVTTDKKRNQLVSELNYHTTKYFSKYLLAIEMIKTKAKMNKPLYLGMSILDISKTLMYEFWYDYIKPKYGDTAKLCYMDTDSFIIHYITEVFTKTLLMMLKDGLINLTLMRMMIDCFQ